MRYEEFESLYERHRERLEKATKALGKLVRQGLMEYRKSAFFRPRLQEARVKDCRSLFDKIRLKDPGDVDSWEAAFEAGSVKDLIGARVVCHNLEDIKRVHDALERQDGLTILSSGEKSIEEAVMRGDGLGYRGLHRRCVWSSDGEEFQGELQVRTLLQDAWASFVHDDVYEHGPKPSIPTPVLSLLKTSSDMLHSIDRMASELRKAFDFQRPSGMSLSKKLWHGLAGMAAWADSDVRAPTYTSVRRRDTYELRGLDGIYDIVIDARLAPGRRGEFVHYLSGDTTARAHCSKVVFEDLVRQQDLANANNARIDFGEEESEIAPLLVRVSHGNRRNRHYYRIGCLWAKTFGWRYEYLHVPWVTYYGVAGEYELKLVADRQFLVAPRIYRPPEARRALELLDEGLEIPHGLGESMEAADETGRSFWKKWASINGNYLIAWQLS